MRYYRLKQHKLEFLNFVTDDALKVEREFVWAIECTNDRGGDYWEFYTYCRGDRDHAERALHILVATVGGEVWDERGRA